MLNEKLAGWRWPDGECLGYFPRDGDVLWGTKEEQRWVNFPKSLDACFKWLVPKLMQDLAQEQTLPIMLENWVKEVIVDNKAPALALCLAIEKLIDKEEING